jgi:hypothetical protein
MLGNVVLSLDWVLLVLRILTTAILYLFLGAAFYIIWLDLKKTQGQNLPAYSESKDRLRVVAATEDNVLAVGETFPLQPVTLLGCGPESTIILKGEAISARHARLSQKNGEWWLEDLGSRNGTRLNDLRLSGPAVLKEGDIISIGNLCFKLETTVLA